MWETCILMSEKLAGDFAPARLILRHVELDSDEKRDHAVPRRRLSGVVPTGHPRGGIGRALGRTRLHGDSSVGLWDLGEHAAPT